MALKFARKNEGLSDEDLLFLKQAVFSHENDPESIEDEEPENEEEVLPVTVMQAINCQMTLAEHYFQSAIRHGFDRQEAMIMYLEACSKK